MCVKLIIMSDNIMVKNKTENVQKKQNQQYCVTQQQQHSQYPDTTQKRNSGRNITLHYYCILFVTYNYSSNNND